MLKMHRYQGGGTCETAHILLTFFLGKGAVKKQLTQKAPNGCLFW